MEGVPQQQSWFRRNMAWVIPVGCLALIAFGCVIFGGAAAIFGGKFIQAEKQAVDRLQATVPGLVRNNGLVVEALGQPVEVGPVKTTGYSNHDGVAEVLFTAPISGPKAKGTLSGVGHRNSSKEEYEVSKMQLEVDGKTIDLLEKI